MVSDRSWQDLTLTLTLEEMGHPQPRTPIQTDNSTAHALLTNRILPKALKAMDMWFNWLWCREAQGQYRFYWRPGTQNLADYWTKHHPASHHKSFRPQILTSPTDPKYLKLTTPKNTVSRSFSLPQPQLIHLVHTSKLPQHHYLPGGTFTLPSQATKVNFLSVCTVARTLYEAMTSPTLTIREAVPLSPTWRVSRTRMAILQTPSSIRPRGDDLCSMLKYPPPPPFPSKTGVFEMWQHYWYVLQVLFTEHKLVKKNLSPVGILEWSWGIRTFPKQNCDEKQRAGAIFC